MSPVTDNSKMGVIPTVTDETPQLKGYLTPEMAPRSTAHKRRSTHVCPRHPTSLVKCSTFLATVSSQVNKRVKRHLLWHVPKDSRVVFANSTATEEGNL